MQNVSGFKVGDLIIIRNYIDNDWIAEHKMLDYWKDKGTGLIGQMYCREIMAVHPGTNELIIDIPIRYALRTAHGAAVYKAPSVLQEVGVEQLSIGNRQSFAKGDWSEQSFRIESNPSYQCHDSWAIAIAQVCNGWIRQVASYRAAENTSNAISSRMALKFGKQKMLAS